MMKAYTAGARAIVTSSSNVAVTNVTMPRRMERFECPKRLVTAVRDASL